MTTPGPSLALVLATAGDSFREYLDCPIADSKNPVSVIEK
jgi:hypothetical protein